MNSDNETGECWPFLWFSLNLLTSLNGCKSAYDCSCILPSTRITSWKNSVLFSRI